MVHGQKLRILAIWGDLRAKRDAKSFPAYL